MYNNAELFNHVVAFGFLFLFFGLMFGFILGVTSSDKKVAAKEKAKENEEKQKKMWNEYLEALKGGRYERK
jgi:F0F1-type ATP synthase assembly protein I